MRRSGGPPRFPQYVLLAIALAALLYGIRARYRVMVQRTIAAANSVAAASASAPAAPTGSSD